MNKNHHKHPTIGINVTPSIQMSFLIGFSHTSLSIPFFFFIFR
jgi:hypothetical protein